MPSPHRSRTVPYFPGLAVLIAHHKPTAALVGEHRRCRRRPRRATPRPAFRRASSRTISSINDDEEPVEPAAAALAAVSGLHRLRCPFPPDAHPGSKRCSRPGPTIHTSETNGGEQVGRGEEVRRLGTLSGPMNSSAAVPDCLGGHRCGAWGCRRRGPRLRGMVWGSQSTERQHTDSRWRASGAAITRGRYVRPRTPGGRRPTPRARHDRLGADRVSTGRVAA